MIAPPRAPEFAAMKIAELEATIRRVKDIREGQVCSGCLDEIRDALDGE